MTSRSFPKECPNCKISWLRPERILDTFKSDLDYAKNYSEQELIEFSKGYGDTEETPQHFSMNVVGVELDRDCVEYWKCLGCGYKLDRFTGEQYVEPASE